MGKARFTPETEEEILEQERRAAEVDKESAKIAKIKGEAVEGYAEGGEVSPGAGVSIQDIRDWNNKQAQPQATPAAPVSQTSDLPDVGQYATDATIDTDLNRMDNPPPTLDELRSLRTSPNAAVNRSPAVQDASSSATGEAPQGTDYQALLDQYNASKGNSPYGNELDDSALKAAQEQRNKQQQISNMLRAGTTIGAALTNVSGKTADQSFSDNLDKQAGTPIENLLARRKAADQDVERKMNLSKLGTEQEMGDSKSQISQTYRDFAKKLGFQVPDTASARQLDKLTPLIERYAQSTENAKQRAHEREMSRSSKEDEKLNKRNTDLNKSLQAELSSSKSAFGKSANIVRSAEALEQLATQVPDLNNLSTRQIGEIARGLDAMLSQGAATISGTKKLIPESYSGSAAKIEEYISNMPKGAQQGAFVRQMMDTVRREKELAKSQIQRTGTKLLAGYQDLKTKRPDLWENTLEVNGLDKGLFNKTAHGAHNPGDVVSYKGKQYKVGDDGDTLEEIKDTK